jgi:tRNA-dihydrouridine synthase A
MHSPTRFSVAPMMDWTDRHCRFFHRLLTKRALLYTEMVTTGALKFGDVKRHLEFNHEEHPVALQLGGSNPADLALSARLGEDYGYDEINLNCGCPSDRVQNGAFGACLMATPDVVADGISAMKAAVKIPVTVKCRIGIDDQDGEQSLDIFIEKVLAAGADGLIIHARKAWLQGLSPKENRDIPPLNYDRVFRLKAKFPHVSISINGGIATLEEGLPMLDTIDGVMLGRAAYQEPWRLADVDRLYFGSDSTPHPDEVLELLIPYVEKTPVKLANITKHILGLYQGQPGARQFRRFISENAHLEGANADILRHALLLIREARLKIAD